MTKDVYTVRELIDFLKRVDPQMSLNSGDGWEVSVCLTPLLGEGTETLVVDELWPDDEDDE